MKEFGKPLLCIALLLGALGHADAAADEYAAIREKLQACFGCHGENGSSEDPEIPILAGQHMYYTYVQLKDFKAGRRVSPIMTEILTGLSAEDILSKGFQAARADAPVMGELATILTKDEMRMMATFFSEQEWPGSGHRTDPEKAKAGATATAAGQCVQCHRGGYEGDSRVPRLAGQYVEYLTKTMSDFKSKERNNSPAKSSLMASYGAQDIAAMADYLAGM